MRTASAQSMTARTAGPRSDIGSIRQLQDDLKQALEDPGRFPRTTKLLAAGAAQQSKKLIEEAAELAIEALRCDRPAAVREAADLIYNLVVLLEGMDIAFEEVCHELERRRTAYGIAAKQKNGTPELLSR